MLSANSMAPLVKRSSLEIMLDALRQADEQPQDLPPALPVRPTSRGRLPSLKRLSVNLNHEIGCPRRFPSNSVELGSKKDEHAPRRDRGVLLETEAFGHEVTLNVDPLIKSPFTMLDHVRCEESVQVADDADSPSIPFPVPNKKIECTTVIEYPTSEVAESEETKNRKLKGILYTQKNYRRLRAQAHYQQMKKGATTLQSFVRGEKERFNFEVKIKRWRAAVVIQKHVRQWFAKAVFNNMMMNIILLQSVVHGWLARKHFSELKKLQPSRVCHTVVDKRKVSMANHLRLECKSESARDPPEHTKDTGDEHPKSHPSVLAEYQCQMRATEAALREKIEENAILKQHLQEYETRWSAYELKMKSMEQSWQKQLALLQMNFAAARENHDTEEMLRNSGVLNTPKLNHYNEGENARFAGAQTPEGTLDKLSNASDKLTPVRNNDHTHNAVIQLMMEFDHRRKVFDDEAGLLVEVKSSDNINSYEELRKLKTRFSTWKKDYTMRLRDTKETLLKLIHPERKSYKKWWCVIGAR